MVASNKCYARLFINPQVPEVALTDLVLLP